MTLLDESPVAAASVPMPPRPLVPGSASTGRWRLAARLARRELRRRPWRTVLVALLVAAPVAGVALVDTAYRSDRLSTAPREVGRSAGRLELIGVDAQSAQADVEALVPSRFEHVAWFSTRVALRDASVPEALRAADVHTLDASEPLAAGIVRVTSGRVPVAADEALLDPDLALQFGVGVGDDIELVRPAQTFHVVGLGEVGSAEDTFLAPGFDVSVLRRSWLSMSVIVGRDGVEGQTAGDVSEWLAHVVPGAIGSAGWGFTPRSSNQPDNPIVLFLGWVGATMLMGALGIVVAAAFAISGRRQLVTIGQLSATGADTSVLRRFLALQGTWTGLAGATLGLAGARGLAAAFDDQLRAAGGLDLRWLDWGVVWVTAVVVASVAALLPARSLARVSTLTALGGRRPVPPVRPRQVRAGVALLAGGSIGLTLSVVMAREANNVGGTLTLPLLFAMAAGSGLLAGVCLLGPAWVSLIARVGRRLRGAARLATRDLDRHRARSGALLAAVMVVGAAAVGVGATVEQEHADDADARAFGMYGNDVLWVTAYDTTTGTQLDLDTAVPDARATIEKTIGTVRWIPQRTAAIGDDSNRWEATIADPDLLALNGFSDDAIETLLASDMAIARPIDEPGYIDDVAARRAFGLPASSVVAEVPTRLRASGEVLFVSADVAAAAGATVSVRWIGQVDHDLSAAEQRALTALSSSSDDLEALAFRDVEASSASVGLSVGASSTQRDWSGLARWATLNVALLLVLLVVGLGLALEAAEGRDDRDTLVALGASPSALASLVAWKAGVIALVGGVLAVPLGYGTLWLCVRAAHQDTTFPWVIAAGVVGVVPAIVALVAWVASRVAQHRRPVRALAAT